MKMSAELLENHVDVEFNKARIVDALMGMGVQTVEASRFDPGEYHFTVEPARPYWSYAKVLVLTNVWHQEDEATEHQEVVKELSLPLAEALSELCDRAIELHATQEGPQNGDVVRLDVKTGVCGVAIAESEAGAHPWEFERAA